MSGAVFTAAILTLFPEMFPGPLGHSLPGRALREDRWRLQARDIRDFATDRHRTVDDTPYGGGAGMVLRADVAGRAIEQAQAEHPRARLIHFTPRGELLTQSLARQLAAEEGLILLCARFEGIDERIVTHYRPLEISLGDFVLFGGEVAAMALLEAVLRCRPGILGNPQTLAEESFTIDEDSALLIEYPHYTKPPSWKGHEVPDILVSGHHERVKAWRREAAEADTRKRRPDLWARHPRFKNNAE